MLLDFFDGCEIDFWTEQAREGDAVCAERENSIAGGSKRERL